MSSSTGTSTAALVAVRPAAVPAALAQKGGCSGGRHTHSSEPSSASAHSPPFSHGHTRGSARSTSTAATEGRSVVSDASRDQ